MTTANQRANELCRQFRKEMTLAEARLWEAIRDRRLGMKFRRQHPFGGIIADFYCLERALVVEVDGGVHLDPEQAEQDGLRDAELTGRGLVVLRFTNEQVEKELPTLLATIQAVPIRHIEVVESAAGPSLSKMERGARRAG